MRSTPQNSLRTTGRVAILTDACIQIRHQRGIAACRQMLRGHAGQHAVLYFVLYVGAVEYRFGRLAAASGELDEAADMLEQAITAHQRSGSTVFEAKSHRHLAAVLWHRNRGADRSEAVRSQEQAMKMAARFGVGELAALPWPPRDPVG